MDDIINKTEEFCTTLGSLQPLCENLIERYLPEIIEGIINNNSNPFDICKLLTICTDGDTTVSGPTTTPQPGELIIIIKNVGIENIYLFILIIFKPNTFKRSMDVC